MTWQPVETAPKDGPAAQAQVGVDFAAYLRQRKEQGQ